MCVSVGGWLQSRKCNVCGLVILLGHKLKQTSKVVSCVVVMCGCVVPDGEPLLCLVCACWCFVLHTAGTSRTVLLQFGLLCHRECDLRHEVARAV